MKRLFTMFGLSALLALAPDASAQQPVPVAAIGRWDVAGQLALLNRNKTELGSRSDHWYEAPLIQGSLAVVFALLMVSRARVSRSPQTRRLPGRRWRRSSMPASR